MANVNDVYSVRVYTAVNNQVGLNVLNYQCAGKVGTGATEAQIATAFDNQFAAPYKALITTSATYRGVQVQKYSPLPVAVAVSSIANSGVGTAGVSMIPTQGSGLISLRTALAGKSHRGRVYIPFPSDSDNTADGRPVAAYLTRLGTLATAMLATISAGAGGNTNTFNLVIHSKLLNSFTLVTVATEQGRWATQRRRGDWGRTNVLPI